MADYITIKTSDPNMVTLMIEEYPGFLAEGQVKKRGIGLMAEYEFSSLERKVFNDFIKPLKDKKLSYEIKQSFLN